MQNRYFYNVDFVFGKVELMKSRDNSSYKIHFYSGVQSKKTKWLWYPYIPEGKITIIQGDPGEGKTTFILNIAALLSRGADLPETDNESEPRVIIYQSAEDDIEDTIKPRLVNANADCTKIAYISVKDTGLMIGDNLIEQCILETGASMLILDPLQAYLGSDADINRAADMRPMMNQLSEVAKRTGCAVVIIGHMNKAAGIKNIYRGLGSIDISAAARSILLVGRLKNEPDIRVMTQLKNNLAPEGGAIAFEIEGDYGVRWIGHYDVTIEDIISGGTSNPNTENKHEQAANIMKELLREQEMPCGMIYEACLDQGIRKRTVDEAKKNLGVKSVKKNDRWYWALQEI
jgi:KaiC/GvpD/RAD55 family RecA-like ATPase